MQNATLNKNIGSQMKIVRAVNYGLLQFRNSSVSGYFHLATDF